MDYMDGQIPKSETSHQEDAVAQALEVYSADENGKVVIPEGTPGYVATALKVEQRRRNANSAYSKADAEAKRLKAENEALKAKMADVAKPTGFSAEEIAELNELKVLDPDAYFDRRTELERAHSTSASSVVETAISEASAAADVAYNQQVTTSRDEAIATMLSEHNTADPEHPITQDMLNLNVPPILVQKFANGELTSAGFMAQVSKFLYADRVVKQEPVLGQPNLGAAASTSAPSDGAKEQSLESMYAGI